MRREKGGERAQGERERDIGERDIRREREAVRGKVSDVGRETYGGEGARQRREGDRGVR